MNGQQKLEQYRQELIKWKANNVGRPSVYVALPEPLPEHFGIAKCCTPESFVARKIREEVLGRNK